MRITDATASRPRYISNQSGRISLYFDHQPGAFARLARSSVPCRTVSSLTPYKVRRSAMSRSLKLTRPFSMRLILDRDPRIS